MAITSLFFFYWSFWLFDVVPVGSPGSLGTCLGSPTNHGSCFFFPDCGVGFFFSGSRGVWGGDLKTRDPDHLTQSNFSFFHGSHWPQPQPAPAPAPAPAQSSLFFKKGLETWIIVDFLYFSGVQMGSRQVSGELPEPFFRGSESFGNTFWIKTKTWNSGTLKLKPETLELELWN